MKDKRERIKTGPLELSLKKKKKKDRNCFKMTATRRKWAKEGRGQVTQHSNGNGGAGKTRFQERMDR